MVKRHSNILDFYGKRASELKLKKLNCLRNVFQFRVVNLHLSLRCTSSASITTNNEEVQDLQRILKDDEIVEALY